jgi:hypothetical protein
MGVTDEATQVVQTTTGQLVSQSVSQVIAGVAKIFVGEIVEKGGLKWWSEKLAN